ncbi:MAG: peptidylprolyl isomerase [Clostridia bacterium]|nr:peptidylprolyl isomerase [Clostridia bacterium]
MTACSNEEYEADLTALQADVTVLQAELEQYSSENAEIINELKDKLSALQTKIEETKPRGKDFEANLTALKDEATGIEDSFNALKIKEDELKLSKVAIETNEITNYVILKVANYGSMVIELYPETAPITVANFQKLVSEAFYDGLIFHRVIENFMIQGGDPLGTGTGGSKEKIKGEFSANGIQNDLKHTNGIVSMARSQSMNSASSQFFICQGTQQHLDGKYAAFGKVIYGIELIDEIAAVKTNSNDKPLVDVVITSIRFATLVQ